MRVMMSLPKKTAHKEGVSIQNHIAYAIEKFLKKQLG